MNLNIWGDFQICISLSAFNQSIQWMHMALVQSKRNIQHIYKMLLLISLLNIFAATHYYL